MVTEESIPSLVGFRPEEAEAAAQQMGLTIDWIDTEAPHWLSERNEPRVARQRLREDGTLELLRVLVPTLADECESVEEPE